MIKYNNRNNSNVEVDTIVRLNLVYFRKWNGNTTRVIANLDNTITFQEEDGDTISIKKIYDFPEADISIKIEDAPNMLFYYD